MHGAPSPADDCPATPPKPAPRPRSTLSRLSPRVRPQGRLGLKAAPAESWRVVAESCSPTGGERSSRQAAVAPASLHAPLSQAPSPRGNLPKSTGVGHAGPGGPITSSAHPGGQDPGRGQEVGSAANRPIHGKFRFRPEGTERAEGCALQPAESPSFVGVMGLPCTSSSASRSRRPRAGEAENLV